MVQGDENSILMNYFLDEARDFENFKFHGHEVDMSCAVESGGHMFIIGNKKFEKFEFVFVEFMFLNTFDFFVDFMLFEKILLIC